LKSGSPINGFASPGVFLAYVTWSLRWEWLFYASLVVTAFFARSRITAWAFPAAGLAVSMALLVRSQASHTPLETAAFIALFCIGMLTAALAPGVAKVNFRTPLFSGLALVLLATVLTLFDTAYAAAPIGLLGAAFFMIANGADLFGLLTSRPARRLGDVSFGIYLLQGLVLSAVFASAAAQAFALAAPLNHWLLIGAAALALVAVSTLAHAVIERPGIDLGRWVLDVARAKPRTP
jgi:peptidoglycan/LPS O-acetylase OafA/YrhL